MNIAVILGSQINAYNIIRELHHYGVKSIIIVDFYKGYAAYSKYINKFYLFSSHQELKDIFKNLHDEGHSLIPYPTSDLFLEYLYDVYEDIKDYTFIPFNPNSIIKHLDKWNQYQICKQIGVPIPKTRYVKSLKDFPTLNDFRFPIIIKPVLRKDLIDDVFRSLVIYSDIEYLKNKESIKKVLKKGIPLLISEVIPGDSSNIFSYVSYLNKKGSILNSWTGRKLTQTPDDFGTCSSASNEYNKQVEILGQLLAKKMKCSGFFQPEFKYDKRDDKYKLMEINFRSMKWHRTGFISGVGLHYTQWCEATNQPIPIFTQNKKIKRNLIILDSEIINLIRRKGYWKQFINVFFSRSKKSFALLSPLDPFPFIVSTLKLLKRLIK
jgi:D-aspartate ligase